MTPPRPPRRSETAPAPRHPRGPAPGGGGGGNGDERAAFTRRSNKVRLHPLAALLLFGTPLVLLGVLIYLAIDRQRGPSDAIHAAEQVDPNAEFNRIKREATEAKKVYKQAMQLRTSADTALFEKRVDEAMEVINDLLERFDAILAPLRDKEGDLPDEYNGYNIEYQELIQMLHDLAKTKGF